MSAQEEKVDEAEIERLWAEEAERRLQEFIDGKVTLGAAVDWG